MSAVDLHMDPSEGGLKELVLRWFTETQAPLIVNNGNFPDWFQGFAARKDTEDLLRDKALGCFLIRLSDKAIGYILSYKGHDRCRHFVITQNQDGQFVISGDCQTHGSLTELIEHYKVSPIQPFGEYLTSSCYEEDTGELYDVVNYNKTSGVSVQALRTLWDHKNDLHSDPGSNQRRSFLWDHKNDLHSNPGSNQRVQPQSDPPAALPPPPAAQPPPAALPPPPAAQPPPAALLPPPAAQPPTTLPPALPPKTNSRKLTGAVSVDTVSLSQGVPPVPKRGIPLGFSLSGSLPETTSHPSETQTDENRSERLRENTNSALTSDSFHIADTSYPGDLCPTGTTYSELTQVESRSRSLPRLNNSSMEEETEYSNQLSSPSFSTSSSYSPTALKKVTCHTYSLHDPRDSQKPSSSRSQQQGGDVEMSRSNPLYHTSEGPTGSSAQSAQQGDAMYAEVPQGPSPAGLHDNTYEQIPGEATADQGNMYESLEDVKTKKSKSTWGKNNMNWKKFLPDYMKK